MWERIKLSNNYSKALEQVPSSPYNLQVQGSLIPLDRQRTHPLAKFHNSQMQAARNQNNAVSHKNAPSQAPPAVRYCVCIHNTFQPWNRPKLVGIKKKLDRREAVRERKALSAAHLERSIEKELIERLKSKAYGDAPLNVNETVWQQILDREKNGGKGLEEAELDLEADETDEEDEEELEDQEDDWGDREFVSDVSDDEDDGLSDLEDAAVSHIPSHIPILVSCLWKNAMSEEDEADDSDSDNSDAAEKTGPKTALGKRKAAPPSKPSRKRPDKKIKSMLDLALSFQTTDSIAEGPRVEVEYENELESVPLTRAALASW